jgi:hypothetical protein
MWNKILTKARTNTNMPANTMISVNTPHRAFGSNPILSIIMNPQYWEHRSSSKSNNAWQRKVSEYGGPYKQANLPPKETCSRSNSLPRKMFLPTRIRCSVAQRAWVSSKSSYEMHNLQVHFVTCWAADNESIALAPITFCGKSLNYLHGPQ